MDSSSNSECFNKKALIKFKASSVCADPIFVSPYSVLNNSSFLYSAINDVNRWGTQSATGVVNTSVFLSSNTEITDQDALKIIEACQKIKPISDTLMKRIERWVVECKHDVNWDNLDEAFMLYGIDPDLGNIDFKNP